MLNVIVAHSLEANSTGVIMIFQQRLLKGCSVERTDTCPTHDAGRYHPWQLGVFEVARSTIVSQ